MKIETNQQYEIKATVIRAGGKREDLGTIIGGNILQKVVSYIKIKTANFKQWLRQF